MTNRLEDQIQRIVASMDSTDRTARSKTPETTEQETQPEETIHIHYFPDAIVILKEEEQAQVVDSTPLLPQKISFLPHTQSVCFYLLLIVSCLRFRCTALLNPPIATVTIIPKSQTVTLSGTLQLRQSLSTSHHFPITNSSNNRHRPPERKSGNRIHHLL